MSTTTSYRCTLNECGIISWRLLLLMLVCVLFIGSTVSYDSIGAIAPYLRREFDINGVKLGWLYSAYHLPGIFVPILSGLLVDYAGADYLAIATCALVLLSTGVMAGTGDHGFGWMLAGRVLLGVGGETQHVAQIKLLSDLFDSGSGGAPSGGGLNFPSLAAAFAASAITGQLASFSMMRTLPASVITRGWSAMWGLFYLALLALVCAIVLTIILRCGCNDSKKPAGREGITAEDINVKVVDGSSSTGEDEKKLSGREAATTTAGDAAASSNANVTAEEEQDGEETALLSSSMVPTTTAALVDSSPTSEMETPLLTGVQKEKLRLYGLQQTQTEVPPPPPSPPRSSALCPGGTRKFCSTVCTGSLALVCLGICFGSAVLATFGEIATDMYAVNWGFSDVRAAQTHSYSYLIAMLVFIPIGLLLDAFGGYQVAILSFGGLSIIAHVTLALVLPEEPAFMASIYGLGVGAIYCVMWPLATMRLHTNVQGRAIGILMCLQNAALVFFPWAIGQLRDAGRAGELAPMPNLSRPPQPATGGKNPGFGAAMWLIVALDVTVVVIALGLGFQDKWKNPERGQDPAAAAAAAPVDTDTEGEGTDKDGKSFGKEDAAVLEKQEEGSAVRVNQGERGAVRANQAEGGAVLENQGEGGAVFKQIAGTTAAAGDGNLRKRGGGADNSQ